MKRLSYSQRKAQRRKIKTSTTAENKLLAVVKRIFKIKLPKNATLDDYRKSVSKINTKKFDDYVQRYTNLLLRTNRNGFINILNALTQGNSGNKKLQEKLDKSYGSYVQEQRIYKPLLQKFQNNLKLIKQIPYDVEAKLQEGYEEGVSFRGTDVEKYLQERLGKRAKLIIRTESSKVNAAITEVRAKNLGINGYIWSTSEDKRVRGSHKLMDGVLVFWNNTPTLDKMTGHAGEFPNCRCVGLPLVTIDDIQFPIRVAEGNLVVESKYVKGSHGKKYDTKIISGRIKQYSKPEFMRVYGKYFNN